MTSEPHREAPVARTKPFPLGTAKNRTALPRPRVLVAEDNEPMCRLLAVYLEEAGYDVVQCRDGYQLVERLGTYLLPRSTESFDLIISDIRMPYLTGMEILEGLCDRDDFPPMILITAFGDAETHRKARELGAAAFFDKPFSIQDLVNKVRELLPVGDGPPSV